MVVQSRSGNCCAAAREEPLCWMILPPGLTGGVVLPTDQEDDWLFLGLMRCSAFHYRLEIYKMIGLFQDDEEAAATADWLVLRSDWMVILGGTGGRGAPLQPPCAAAATACSYKFCKKNTFGIILTSREKQCLFLGVENSSKQSIVELISKKE